MSEDLYTYLNEWADLDSGEYDHLKAVDGKRTPWADGYRQAAQDIFQRLKDEGVIERRGDDSRSNSAEGDAE